MSLKKLGVVFREASAVEAFLAISPVSNNSVSSELRERAQALHANHQLPYVLSRLAASAAISTAMKTPISFVGGREDARKHGAFVSLAHEELVGAAVAWNEELPFVFGIDVVDVVQLSHVRRRFPHFGKRCVPCCQNTFLRDIDVTNLQSTYGRFIDPVDVVLAQHWGLRECCVKLVGVRGRSFPFDGFRGPVALLPEQFGAQIVGSGREALHSAGLHSNLFVWSWPEVVQQPSGEQRPFVVILAACRKAS